MYFLKLPLFFFILNCCIFNTKVYSRSDSIFKQLAFGKGVTVISAGGGAIKRHANLYSLDPSINEYYRSPSFSFSVDHCFYPYASNAYLGIGPFFSVWSAIKNFSEGSDQIETTMKNVLISAKLTHHATYFIRKKWDVCSAYFLGLNIRQYDNYTVNGNQDLSKRPKPEYSLAIAIGLTIRYYFAKNTGVYLEGGIGYKINLLNVGICYKLKNKKV